jgi:septal ring factor EnvC (AmiA/AmiB activator)
MEFGDRGFPANSMLWTKHMFHVDEKFREWIMEETKKICPNIDDLIKRDESVNNERRSAEQKNRSIMTALWDKIRVNAPSRALVDNKYYEARLAFTTQSMRNELTTQTHTLAETNDKLKKLENNRDELRSYVFTIIKTFSTICNEMNETIERQKVEIDKLSRGKN